MSCSVFRDIDDERHSSTALDDVEDEKLKLEKNLVILVNNKSGKVSVDERTLHSLLANETTNTSVSIVSVSSPTPSMHEEMDEEERHNMEMSQEELMQTLTEGDDDAPVQKVNKKSSSRIGITVESFYPPEEAKNFVAEVLSLAGIHNPISIDYEFQRYVIQNDHCYTNLTLPSKAKIVSSKKSEKKTPVKQLEEEKQLDLSPRSQRVRKPSVRLLESSEMEVKPEKDETLETSSNKDEQEPFEDSESEYESEESESSIEDNDNDSDLDFDINRSNRPPKKGKKKRKVPKSKAILKYGSKIAKKRQSTRSIDSEEPEKDRANKSQNVKKQEKRPAPLRKVVSKGKQPPADLKEAGIVANQPKDIETTIKSEVIAKVPVASTSSNVAQVSHKKEKKKESHDALFSDMSSLFSNPDKIKKIETKSQIPQQKVTKTAHVSEQLDLIDSIVQNDLQHNASIVESEMAEELPSIVKMLENPETDIPDNALLETLGESLPEDFLHTVAELAENKEIQEIIDKQVLGVDIDQPMTSTTEAHSVSLPVVTSTPIQKNTKAANVSLTEARKHPLKVMRSDGRVITLPPIEVPTTRGAKKRLQNDSTSEGDSSSVANVESKSEEVVVTAAKIKKSLSKDEKRQSREQSREKSTSRRSSTNRSSTDTRSDSTSRRKRAITNPAVLAVLSNEKADDSESGESWNSEDDPDRLWCICRQPHNNRFMICCDVCEEWFHGKCVNITKAQGNQMEAEGKDWTCPNCIKKKQEKEQPKITSFLNESGEKKKLTQPGSSHKLCLVCKKPARPGSIYCSDECIGKHAQNALVHTKLGSKSDIKSSPSHKSDDVDFDKQIQTSKIVKNKENRVIVFERATNRCLTGANAPTAQNLKQWLKEHPTFQAVTPGTAQMNAIMAKKRQLKEVALKMQTESSQKSSSFSKPTTIQTKLKMGESQKLTIASPKDTEEKKLPTLKSPHHHHHSSPKTPTTPTHSRHSGENPTKSSSHEKKPVKRQSSTDLAKPGSSKKDTRDHDMIRLKSKEGLQTALEERMNEVEENKPRLTSEEIKEFAHNVENELYLFFNKDCNQKYKVKYRSLVFNIRDRKNLTLFQKICEKSIKPYRLVRMEPQDLASQELAKWRENENKHQLEMIKKSELELLAASKNYVLKTHKGEEVYESKKIDRVELDPNMAVEDVVKVLNSSTNQTLVQPKPSSSNKGHDDSYYVKSYTHGEESGSHSKDKDKKHHHSSSSSSKHSKHKRKHSRDRSESRHHGHDSKKSRRSPERSRHESRRDKKHEKRSPDRTKEREREKKKPVKELDIPTPTQEDFNLIDKILEGSQVVLTRPGAVTQPSTSTKIEDPKPTNVESDQEPTSTVNIPSPVHVELQRDPSPVVVEEEITWKGTLTMIDVASFHVEAKPVSGDFKSIVSHLPKSLEVVGRIAPETVWDYIDKIQKSPNKEVIILRFSSSNEISYETLYKYYDIRRRLGVIKSHSSVVKDFYMLPLGASKELPSVLKPIKGVGFVEGKNKPDLLIGVIVKIKKEKPSKLGLRPKVKPQIPLLPPIITKQSLENIDPSFSITEELSSKSASRKSKLLALGLPKATSDEEDEPYSPGDSDENDVSSSALVTTSTVVTVKQTVLPDEEAVKLDEINREIQARKMEIAGMLNVDPDSLDEPYSPSRPVSPPTTTQASILPGLDKIAIPSNLSEILASIKSVTPSSKDDTNDEYDPTTTTISGGLGLGFYQSTSVYKASGFTETTQVSVSDVIPGTSHGEKRKLGEGDLDLRVLPPGGLPISMDTTSVNEEDCFEIPDEQGVKRTRWDKKEAVSEGTGDLDLRMLNN